MDTITVAIICVLFALVVWLWQGSRKRETIKENNHQKETSKAPTAMSMTTHGSSFSQSRECMSVSGRQKDQMIGSDEDVFCENTEQILNDILKDCENTEVNKIISSVQLEKLQEKMIQKGPVHGLNQHIQDSLDAWKKLELNVAVTGNAGVGKSSLINALRKVKPSDKDAAKVDVVECAIEGRAYTYPENKHVALWDLPGTGTLTFTRQEYLERMNFSRFDVVIIVSAVRFLEDDIWLGKELFALRKNILFVRTKIDIDIMNAKRDHPEQFSKENCIEKIRNNLNENILTSQLPKSVSGVYLVSSPERDLYDFAKLDEMLKSLLSKKGRAIRVLLQIPVEKAIKEDQAAVYKNEFKVLKTAAVVYGFLPIPNLETVLGNMSVASMRETCLKKFCIDDSSLDKISDEIHKPKDTLKQSLESYRSFKEDTLLESTEGKMWSFFRKNSKYIVPVIGMFLSAHKTYLTLQQCLKSLCDKMANDELLLVKWRLDRLEDELQPFKQ